jgi:hypothetical protein
MRSHVIFAVVLMIGCGPPKNHTPVDQIPSLGKLSEVMDVQATTADPQFKKISQETFSEQDWVELKETAAKISATSKRIKAFSGGKGAGFDALADRLGENATALGAAADAKDAAKTKTALTEMKATCKECHSKFR